ncbi:MAG: type II toxin-antitoxin system HicA family toxin [Chitinophagales bacterium]|nr:type II toxin-antitoxin system HicA family toxin [Chitinophagales bacterium]
MQTIYRRKNSWYKKGRSINHFIKREDLLKILNDNPCVLLRSGGKQDIYHNPNKGTTQPIPRHNEINELLAKKIIKDLI